MDGDPSLVENIEPQLKDEDSYPNLSWVAAKGEGERSSREDQKEQRKLNRVGSIGRLPAAAERYGRDEGQCCPSE